MNKQTFRTLLAFLCISCSLVLFQNCDQDQFATHENAFNDSMQGARSGGGVDEDSVINIDPSYLDENDGSSFTCIPNDSANNARLREIRIYEDTGLNISINYSNDQGTVSQYTKNNVAVDHNDSINLGALINSSTLLESFKYLSASTGELSYKDSSGNLQSLGFKCF